MHNSANGGLCDAKQVGQGAVTRPVATQYSPTPTYFLNEMDLLNDVSPLESLGERR